MKKTYIKPLISVEEISLGQSIAATCTADRDDMLSLMDLGFFIEEKNCSMWIGFGEEGRGGKIDADLDGDFDDGYNATVCYHSNITTAFLS